MKRLQCVVLALAMVMSLNVFAGADSGLQTALEGADTAIPSFNDFSVQEKSEMDRATLSSTTDVVILSEKDVKVQTEEGVLITYKYSSEDVVCITQDMMQQSYLYLLLFKNPTEAAKSYIADGVHLDIVDFSTGAEILVFAAVSGISYAVQDLAALSEDDISFVKEVLVQNIFTDAMSVTVGTIGNNLWYFADYGTGGAMVTYVNGVEVCCMFRYSDINKGPVTELTLLENLSVTAA